MRKYNAKIISREELDGILNIDRMINFSNGFVNEQRVDWWGELEKYLNEPVVSVRPSGREGWNEIIVLTANGHVEKREDEGVLHSVLDYQTADEIITVLLDIFMEADNDEYEVFEHYSATCSPEEWKKVKDYVYEKF